MADRPVTYTGKDHDGDITKLCNSGRSWSPRYKHDAINDIESGTHRYYVPWPGNPVSRSQISPFCQGLGGVAMLNS